MDRLRDIVANTLQMSVNEITDDLKRGDGNWDSFNHLVVITEVEKGLGISFNLDEPGQIETFHDLATAVAEKLRENE